MVHFLPGGRRQIRSKKALTVSPFPVGVVLLVSFFFLIVSLQEPPAFGRLRQSVIDKASGLFLFVQAPVSFFVDASRFFKDTLAQQDVIQDLRTQNRDLRLWQDYADYLERENDQLRALLRYFGDRPSFASQFVTGRILVDNSGRYVRSFLLDVGADQGVQLNDIAMAGGGLVGRVIELGAKTARVLLLTDLNARVPVTVVDIELDAILAGENDPQPLLLYVLPTSRGFIQHEMQVVTSGAGGVFPPNLPVGRIDATGDPLKVQLHVKPELLRYVYVFHYVDPGRLNFSEGNPSN